MKYHFRCKTGWQGSPCGLVFFRDSYHLFYSTNPDADRYGNICTGHAVSGDMIDWEEQGIVAGPGVHAGSALVSGDMLRLFYTREDSAGIFEAVSDDGYVFAQREAPVALPPAGKDYQTFRDPYVFEYGNKYYMTVGAGSDGVAKVLLYESEDLTIWDYKSELLSDTRFGSAIESPSVFRLEDTWVFMIQGQKHVPSRVLIACGEFDGEKFIYDEPADPFRPVETGTEFYNPVPAEDEDGNVVLIAWLFSTKLGRGMLTVPREMFLDFNGRPALMPVRDLMPALKTESRFVDFDKGTLRISIEGRTLFTKQYRAEPDIGVIEDTETVELFLDGGTENISLIIC